MELVEGQTLAERIKRARSPKTRSLACQIADGLQAAHDKGIVHRDLKPANIKITPAARSSCSTSALQRPMARTATPRSKAPTLTVASIGAGVILGTAAYMAPEQARGRNVDKRADVWAFAVIVDEMLTGTPMFGGDTVTDILAAVVRQEPDLSRIPAKTRTMLERCLEKDPKRRIRDVGDALLLLDVPTATHGTTSRRPLWTISAVAALLAIALVLVSYAHFLESPAASEVVRFQIGLPDDVNFTQNGISAISPDGRKVAFAAYGNDGTPRVWVHSLESAAAAPLMDARMTQLSFGFFWSPDSRFIVYPGQKTLHRININGGSPETLAEVAPVFGGSWSGDGTIVIGTANGIMRMPANGGALTPVTKPATAMETHAYPSSCRTTGTSFTAKGRLRACDPSSSATSTQPLMRRAMRRSSAPTMVLPSHRRPQVHLPCCSFCVTRRSSHRSSTCARWRSRASQSRWQSRWPASLTRRLHTSRRRTRGRWCIAQSLEITDSSRGSIVAVKSLDGQASARRSVE